MNRYLPSSAKIHNLISHFVHPYGLAVILIVFVVLAWFYDITVPFFEKPDELKHLAVIQFIQTHRQLPVVQAGVYKPWDQEGTQPPLYHTLAAAAVSWLDLRGFEEPPRNPHYVDERSFIWRERGNNNLYLHAVNEAWSWSPVWAAARLARWLSLLAGLGTVSLTYWLARIIFVDSSRQLPKGESENRRLTNWLPLLSVALVAFVPQFLHVSSAITNDSLSVTLAAAALVILALVIKNGSSTRYALYLGVVLGLAAITKLSLLYLIPLTGLVLLFDLGRHRVWRHLVRDGAIIGGLMLLLAGWWYARNAYLYGDITALNAHLLYRGGPLNPTPTLVQLWQTELTGLELSFWGAFGAGQILFEPWLYNVLWWGKYIVLVGILIGLWGWIKCQVSSVKCQVGCWQEEDKYQNDIKLQNTQYVIRNTQLITLFLLILWTITIYIALLHWMQITPASWGRLLYPALPALGVLAAWGLSQIGLLLARNTPRTTRPIFSLFLPALFVCALFLLALFSPFCYIQPTYAKTPFIAEADLPAAGLERLDLVYDDALRLLGYKIEQPSARPGEWLPVTLYWQAIRPIDKNYSVFIHLLGQDNTVVGQVNTYPNHGNWPTSLLPPGRVLADTYYVYISPEAYAPAVIRLALGIFEFDDPQRAAKKAVDPTGVVVEPIVGAIPLLPHQWPPLTPAQPRQANFAGQIQLGGYDWPHPSLKPGDIAPLTLYWQTLTPPGQNLNLFIHLVNAAGQQAAGFDAPPSFPTGFWQTGNTIIDSRQLAIPPDLPPGEYKLLIGWYNLDSQARLPLVLPEGGDALLLLTVVVK